MKVIFLGLTLVLMASVCGADTEHDKYIKKHTSLERMIKQQEYIAYQQRNINRMIKSANRSKEIADANTLKRKREKSIKRSRKSW